MEKPPRRAPIAIETARRVSRLPEAKSALLASATVAVMLVVAFLVGIRVDLSGNPADADTAAIDEAPVPHFPQTPSEGVEKRPRPGRSRSRSRPEPQRFAWAPAPGASGYHLELFRGSSKVFEADTKRPAITIPAHWTFGGQTRSLEPAEYRWNVWPVFAGGRAARAIVQARLVVPRG